MIYEKNGMSSSPDKTRYHQKFEYMFILSKSTKPKTFNPLMDRKNRWYGSWGVVTHRDINGNLTGKRKIICKEYGKRFNIWKYNTGKHQSSKDVIAFQHPAIFPEELAKDCILSWSNEDDIILDPFMGSGTTAKACILLNRNFIGCDISQKYCEIANKRIEITKKKMEEKEMEPCLFF
jgi:site-specific DNA-methyltransferase (adenine-specific)